MWASLHCCKQLLGAGETRDLCLGVEMVIRLDICWEFQDASQDPRGGNLFSKDTHETQDNRSNTGQLWKGFGKLLPKKGESEIREGIPRVRKYSREGEGLEEGNL